MRTGRSSWAEAARSAWARTAGPRSIVTNDTSAAATSAQPARIARRV